MGDALGAVAVANAASVGLGATLYSPVASDALAHAVNTHVPGAWLARCSVQNCVC